MIFAPEQPFPAFLCCPSCGRRHYDEGEWTTRPHRRHQCAHCRFRWIVEPLCFGAYDCDWPECELVGPKPRALVGGGVVYLCDKHEADGDRRGQLVPA
jgi:hypothetical protein